MRKLPSASRLSMTGKFPTYSVIGGFIMAENNKKKKEAKDNVQSTKAKSAGKQKGRELADDELDKVSGGLDKAEAGGENIKNR